MMKNPATTQAAPAPKATVQTVTRPVNAGVVRVGTKPAGTRPVAPVMGTMGTKPEIQEQNPEKREQTIIERRPGGLLL